MKVLPLIFVSTNGTWKYFFDHLNVHKDFCLLYLSDFKLLSSLYLPSQCLSGIVEKVEQSFIQTGNLKWIFSDLHIALTILHKSVAQIWLFYPAFLNRVHKCEEEEENNKSEIKKSKDCSQIWLAQKIVALLWSSQTTKYVYLACKVLMKSYIWTIKHFKR